MKVKKKDLPVILPAMVTVTFFVVTVLLFFPGGMSGDSLDQWRQVIDGDINSWHPPSMVYMWRALRFLGDGPFPMLFFHSFLYWGALYLISISLFKSIPVRIITITFLGFFPPMWLLVGTVWKDTGLLVSFLFVVGIAIAVSRRVVHKSFLLPAIFLLIYGSSVRHNALVASFPLIMILVMVAFEHLKFRYTFVVSLLLLVVLGIGINQFNKHMVDHRTYNVSNSIFFWDLWGMSIDVNKNLMPNYLFHRNEKEHRSLVISVEELKEYYDPHCNTVIWPTTTGLRGDRYTRNFPDKQFKKDFIAAVMEYPHSYITVRKRAVTCLLGLTCDNSSSGLYLNIARFPKNHYLYRYSRSFKIGSFVIYPRMYFDLTRTYFYKTWVYLVGCILVFGISLYLYIKKRENLYAFSCLCSLSGLFYWAPYIIVATCSDFRYNTWMIASFLVSLTILIVQMTESRTPHTYGKWWSDHYSS
jgi:hypothetical protein